MSKVGLPGYLAVLNAGWWHLGLTSPTTYEVVTAYRPPLLRTDIPLPHWQLHEWWSAQCRHSMGPMV